MEIILEAVLLEAMAIALRLAFLRLVEWLRTRSGPVPAPTSGSFLALAA